MRVHYQSWAKAIRAQNADFVLDWPVFCSMGGMSTHDTLAALKRRFSLVLDEEQLRASIDATLAGDALDNAEPCEDVLELARKAIADGLKVAVASGGQRRYVQRTLRAIHAETLFPVVVTGDDVLRMKPAPDLFLLAAEKLGVKPASCLVIEDSPRGREAAEAAGMACLLVEPR